MVRQSRFTPPLLIAAGRRDLLSRSHPRGVRDEQGLHVELPGWLLFLTPRATDHDGSIEMSLSSYGGHSPLLRVEGP
jgi:hypothetical protein